MKILLVEDEPRVASFVAKGLRARGHQVEWLDAGFPALRVLEEVPADLDLVVLDLGLPDLDGLDVLQRLRDQDNAVPVVILSARQDDRSTARAQRLGVRRYLAKPFKFADLVSTIEDCAPS